jgi:hypothetical protein
MDAETRARIDRLWASLEEVRAESRAFEQQFQQLRARCEELEAENRSLRQRLERQRARCEELEAENRSLRQRLDEAVTAAARQAAPFRRREAKKIEESQKKRPGRPKGHPGANRAIPEHVDQEIEVKLTECPKCQGPVSDITPIRRYIEEIETLLPKVYQLLTYAGECLKCGSVFSSHPLQTAPGPLGSKVQIGPRALAIAEELNKQYGLTMRKTCAVLRSLAGLRLTPGGLAQALQRAAGKVEPEYENLKEKVRNSPAVFADETSWWVGGPKWWLWTFTTDIATVYAVEKSRGTAVVTDMLGDDFGGMLVSDCLSIYDRPNYRKHKCIAHHQRAISEARASPEGAGSTYLRSWKWLLVVVAELSRARSTTDATLFEHQRARIESSVDELLRAEPTNRAEQKIRNRLFKQRAHLLGCLYEPAAEATNNRAERALRPAVIARKVSCGNKTESGKRCWEILASLAATCHQAGDDFLTWLAPRLASAYAG